jgi:FkbM family methyltransferase
MISKKLFFIYLSLIKTIKRVSRNIFRVLNGIVSLVLKSSYIQIRGHKFFLDERDSAGYSIKPYEPYTIELLKEHVKKDDYVIDIGAAIGYYSLELARLVGERGKVFSFEPEENNFQLLQKNIQVNNYENIIPVKKAVLDKKGVKNLYIQRNIGSHSLYNEFDGTKSKKVEIISLDEFFKDVDRKISFIKIDIEGSEAKALKGGEKLIKKNKPAMVIEFVPERVKDAGFENPKDFLKIIKNYGYKLYYIDEQKRKIRDAKINKLIEKCKKTSFVNLLCLPKK